MFPVKSRPGSLTAIGENIISINWEGMAAVFSLGLSGYILRRLPETGAKFLDGERTKGDCSSPKWNPLFRRTTGKFDALELILMRVYIYISQCQPRNVYGDRTRISVCVNASTSSDTSVHKMKPAPATRLIPSSCAENVARTACESFSEFIITSIRIKSSIHDSVRSWKIVCRGYCRLLLQTTFGYTRSYAKQEVGRYRAATTQKFS